MNDHNFPRLLIISNDCLSYSGSNGRTLLNLLNGYPNDKIAQFYLNGNPDTNICKNNYRVDDNTALKMFLSLGMFDYDGNVLLNESTSLHEVSIVSKRIDRIKKSCFIRCARDFIWRSNFWWNDNFSDFICQFSPEVILFQAGDSPFMYRIVRQISRELNIPIVLYNSENYVLKEKLYSHSCKIDPAHWILQHTLRNEYKKIMNTISYCVYSTEYLEQCYQKKYPHIGKSTALYISSELKDCSSAKPTDDFRLVYCGNLGVGRVPVLGDVASVLYKCDSSATLDIYGNFINEKDREFLERYDNVVYHGAVPYAEVPRILASASVVLHCENNDRLDNLRAAFSTKIADSLACGTPFLVYASREYPFVKYLENNCSAHIAETNEELFDLLKQCIVDIGFRNQYLENAQLLAHQNHNVKRNSKILRNIIESCINDK